MKNMKLRMNAMSSGSLNRSKLKSINGGVAAGACDNWGTAEFSTCYNCCLGNYQSQTDLPMGPAPYEICDTVCGGTPVVIHP
ncbi:hypothetical protein [Chryseobacterium vrystaatense]|uniref:Uncharacterized protein n=1 Tax=Chryseobacterium vrystaatense TaxID=307480 RepID=A0A1M5DPJ5_9FLAO|nr:hypothetical protein [Chryseobacterium vrystaatense]SHF68791.1 hypothetical protein SAMN02787073_2671 [Chryseobacterium vrystaatense]